MKILIAVFLTLFATNAFCGPSDWPFYAFDNGARFGSHEEKAAALKELGYDGIGSAKMPGDGDIAGMLKAFSDHDLPIVSFYVGGKVGESISPALADLIPKLKGTDVVLELFLQGNKAKHTDENAVAFVQDIADRAKEAGIEVVLYPHTGFYIETIGDAVRIAKQCDRENVGVMFNLCHFLKVEPKADLEATLQKAKPFLRQVSVSGATVGGTSWGQLIQPLGDGNYDQAALLKALEAIDFQGPVGLQCYNVKGEPKVFLKKSVETWKKLTDSKKP